MAEVRHDLMSAQPLVGTKFSITGCLPIPEEQRRILSKRIQELGGSVKLIPSSSSKKLDPLDESLTHILLVDCDDNLTEESIKKKLKTSHIAFEKVVLVKVDYIFECKKRGVLVDANESDKFNYKFPTKKRVGDVIVDEDITGPPKLRPHISPSSTSSTFSSSTASSTSSFLSSSSPFSSAFSVTSGFSETVLVETRDHELLQNRMRPGWHRNESQTIMFRLHEQHTVFKSESPLCFIGFDMDGTLIRTKLGDKYPKDANDWVFLYKEEVLKQKLQELWQKGYYIAILSNQGFIRNGYFDNKALQMRTKVDEIIRRLEVPIDFICALGSASVYRKPAPGMWDFLSQIRCPNFNREGSQFVGDAAGRAGDVAAGLKVDFADTDLKLALNAGVGFQTPEEFFLSNAQDQRRPKLKVDSRMSSMTVDNNVTHDNLMRHVHLQEIVVLVGVAASGKSTLARLFDSNTHVRVNRDGLGTTEKCLEKARAILSLPQRKSVIVDNTNVDKEMRKKWIDLANSWGVPIRCIYIKMIKEQNELLNTFRFLDEATSPADHRLIPQVHICMIYEHFHFVFWFLS